MSLAGNLAESCDALMQCVLLDTYLDQLAQRVESLGEVNAEVVALKLPLGWIFPHIVTVQKHIITRMVVCRWFY